MEFIVGKLSVGRLVQDGATKGILSGGVGEDIHVQLNRIGWNYNVISIAVENPVIKASSPEDQIRTAGLDGESVAARIKNSLGR